MGLEYSIKRKNRDAYIEKFAKNERWKDPRHFLPEAERAKGICIHCLVNERPLNYVLKLCLDCRNNPDIETKYLGKIKSKELIGPATARQIGLLKYHKAEFDFKTITKQEASDMLDKIIGCLK